MLRTTTRGATPTPTTAATFSTRKKKWRDGWLSLCVLLCLVAFTFAVKSGSNDDASEASSGYVVGVGEEDAGGGMRTRAEDEKEARFSHWEGGRTKRRNGSTLRREKPCGNAPKEFLPDDLALFSGVEHERDEEEKREVNIINDDDDDDDEAVTERTIYRRKRRQLLISRARAFANRNGLTMPTGCDEKAGFVKHENFGEGAKPSVTFKNEGEKMLKKCVETTKRGEDCVNIKAVEAAKDIAKTAGFVTTTTNGDGRKYLYETCALVGNGGSVLRKKFGTYINNHDAVVRFNMAPIVGFEQHVGNRTDVWVNGHEASKRLCCIGSAKMGAQAKDHVMWFPAKQSVIKSACEKRRIKTKALNDREIPGYVAKMNKMRYESRRLGLGKNYDNWLQLTTGAHGIFYFLSKCRRVSVYGFSVWKERNAMGENLDQYGGRKSKVHSGNIFHDWSMETNAWKILHVANVLDVCT